MMESQTFSEQLTLGGFESPFESPFELMPEAGSGFEAGYPGPVGEDEVFPSGLVLTETSGATGPGEEHWDPNKTGLPLLSTGAALRSQKVSPNFTVGELVRSGGQYADVARISPQLVRLLQGIRERAGKAVKVTSGYRSWKRNGKVYKGYGKPPTLSRHCSGQAADITIAGLTGMEIAKLAIDVWGTELGVGIGKGYAHVDVRPRWGSWTYLGGDADKRALREIRAYRAAKKGGTKPPVPVPVPPVPIPPVPVVPGSVRAGGLIVPASPLLASHRGTHPDVVLGWNDMSSPTAIDVVVHLHGFSPSGKAMRLDTEKLPLSGLGLSQRSRPTLTVLPRGDFYGGSSGRGYDFPALKGHGRIDALVSDALARFTAKTGVSAPRGRLILTAHSGGGKALLAILANTDPDEVHVFDALYQPSTALGDWMERRIAQQLGSPASPPPAMRVLYRVSSAKVSTQPSSETLGRRLAAVLSVPGAAGLRDRFRVERTTEVHDTIPRRYGATLLGDAGADLPGTSRFPAGSAGEAYAGFAGLSGLAGPEGAESLAWDAFEAEGLEAEGFEPEGFEPESLEAEGFEPEGFEPESFEPESFEAEGFEAEGFEPEAFEPESLEPEGFESEGLEPEWFSPEGYERENFEPESFEPESFEAEGLELFEPEGYEAEGFESEGFEPGELETEAFEPEAFEPEAFEAEGFDPESLDPELLEPESFEPESFEPEYETPVAPVQLDSEQLDPAVVGLSDLVAEEFENEGFDSFSAATHSVETSSPSAGSSLRPAPPSATADPDYADPNNAGLPLLSTPPSTHRMRLAKNFTVKELVSSGGQASPYARISPELVRVLQAVRDRVGRAVYVDSGFRSWARNVAVYRARGQTPTKSRHCSGQAADIRVNGMSGETLAKLAIDATDGELALGIGSNYIHLDVRGTWALWTYIPGQAGIAAKQAVFAHHAKKKKKPQPKPKPQPQPQPNPKPAPQPIPNAVDARFSVIRPAFLATNDATIRATLLQRGVDFARAHATDVRKNAGKATSITATTRARIIAETGVGRPGSDHPHLDANALTGRVTNDRFEDAYAAWAENPTQSVEPWILMALWAKEGLTTAPIPATVQGNDTADARAIWRSSALFINFGTDHYVNVTAHPGADNSISTQPGAGADHDRVFRRAIADQVSAGRLPRNIAGEIDAQLTVTADPATPGVFTVVAGRRFFVLALMLTDAFWRETHAAAAAIPAVTASSPNELDLNGMAYLKWNTRPSSFNQLVRRDMTKNPDPDGTVPTLPVWAFHREVKKNQFDGPRSNAIRMMFNIPIFREVYEGP